MANLRCVVETISASELDAVAFSLALSNKYSLLHEFCFTTVFEIEPKIAFYRLQTHRRGAHRNFFRCSPSYFKIGI